MPNTRHPQNELRVVGRHLSELQASNARRRYSIAKVRAFAAEGGGLDAAALLRLSAAEQELEEQEEEARELQRRLLALEERARRR